MDLQYLKKQTTILEPEKINIQSIENDYSILSAEKAKDYAGTELIPPKVTYQSPETYPAKTHDKVEDSIEKESLAKSKIDNT